MSLVAGSTFIRAAEASHGRKTCSTTCQAFKVLPGLSRVRAGQAFVRVVHTGGTVGCALHALVVCFGVTARRTLVVEDATSAAILEVVLRTGITAGAGRLGGLAGQARGGTR